MKMPMFFSPEKNRENQSVLNTENFYIPQFDWICLRRDFTVIKRLAFFS